MVVELFREVVITNACIAWSQIDDELISLLFSKSRPNIKLTGSVLLSFSLFFFLILYFLLSVSVYRKSNEWYQTRGCGTESKWWSYCEWGSFRLHSCIKALETHFSFLISLLMLFHFCFLIQTSHYRFYSPFPLPVIIFLSVIPRFLRPLYSLFIWS